MPFSDTYAHQILNFMFSKTSSITAPSHIYIGLSSNNPEADNGTFTELSGYGYARVLVSMKGSTYPDVIGNPSSRSITNVKQINWNKASGGAWVTANGFGLFDSSSGGTPFYYGKLTEPVTVGDGAVALFDPNTLRITISSTDEEGT